MSQVYGIQKNYKNAYTHLSNYVIAQDSLTSEVKTNIFLYYQSQFETERKDNEVFKKKAEIKILQKKHPN